ncbi:hypothetical protein ACSVJV_003450 [Vibrio cholerae]|uniref:hypothetical protein n=1 Tax=Vibrio cholerae TaxID=666 RepID=UPI002FF0EE03
MSCSFFEDNPFISGVVYKDRDDFIYFSPEYRTGISLKDWISIRGVECFSNSLSGEIELDVAEVNTND